MTRCVALLYTVVLTAGQRIRTVDLLEIGRQAGVRPLRTVLSTGNLIFDSDAGTDEAERALEAALLSAFGKPIPVFVRSAVDLGALVAANPFPDETATDPARVAVRIMRRNPAAPSLQRMIAACGPAERFAHRDRALWLATPDQLSSTALLRAVGAKWAGEGTFRSASALAKIIAALD